MITKNGLLRPNNRNSSLITSFKQKARPTKTDSSETDIDFDNIPTIQGTYKAMKVNLTESATLAGGTTELTTDDIEDAAKKVPSRERTHTTTTRVVADVATSPTTRPSTPIAKATTTMFSVDETRTVVASTSAINDHPEMIFKDLRNPDFETSPWKPIVPEYATELKPLPDSTEDRPMDPSTQKTISSMDDREDDAGVTPPAILSRSPLQSVNFGSAIGMSTFDTDNTDFPRDRIVPGLTAPKLEATKRPDIEMAGQLPPETYSVKLKASSERDDGMADRISEILPRNPDILHQRPHITDPNITQGTGVKTSNTLVESGPHRSENPEKITNESTGVGVGIGVGVAEPVLDPELELNARNRYASDILASDTVMEQVEKEEEEEEKEQEEQEEVEEKEEDAELRDRKAEVRPRRPIYTSYNTPDLNGDNSVHRSSLISNSATMKPFRHTIPVDKIASVVNYGDTVSSHDAAGSSFPSNAATDIADESNDQNIFQYDNPGRKNATLGSETVAEIEVSLTRRDDAMWNNNRTMIQLPSYEQIAPTGVDDDGPSRLDNGNDGDDYSGVRLAVDDNADSAHRKTVSRNSTFVKIDTVKHTPGQPDISSDHYSSGEVFDGDDQQQRNKIYNDTLKAYVVENLVTMAPAKSNTGIGKPVRPRPKIDQPTGETIFLGQLFRLHDHERDDATTRRAVLPADPVAREATQSAQFNENESSIRKIATVQQIIEIVTSISTKVSSSMKGDPTAVKIVTVNSTVSPVIRADHDEEDRSLAGERPTSLANLRTVQITSDRRIDRLEENRVLLEKLKRLAQVRIDDDPMRNVRNGSRSSSVTLQVGNPVPKSSLNIDELRKIADIATSNETMRNASLEFTLSRDGVKVLTKVLNKARNRTTGEITRSASEPDGN